MQHSKSLSIIGMQLATQHALQSRNVISFYLSSFYVEYIGIFFPFFCTAYAQLHQTTETELYLI